MFGTCVSVTTQVQKGSLTRQPALSPSLLPELYQSLLDSHQIDPPLGMPSVGSPEVGLPSYNIHISDTNTNIGTPVRGVESLPDIVHSHSVPHALSPRPNQHRPTRDAGNHHHRQRRHQSGSHFRERNRRESSRNPLEHQQGWRRSRTHSSTSTQTEEGRCKEPCMKCMLTVTSFRWVLVVLSVLGVLCVVTGIVLAALHAEGNSFLFLAIMFIGEYCGT